MLRVIDEVRPTWVIGENVAGITTMVESCEITDMGDEASLFEEDNGVHRFRAEYAFTIERICRDLESKGYSVQPMLIPACAVGAPHRRDRVFIIAHSSSSGGKSHSQDGRTESNRCNELSQPGKWREQTEFDNGLSALSRPARSEIQKLVKTPCSMDAKADTRKSKGVSGTSGTLAQEIASGYIEKRGQILPTPTAGEGVKWTNTYNPNSQMGQSLSAIAGSGMLPTPSARDWKGKTNPGVVKEGSGCIYGETLPDAVERMEKDSGLKKDGVTSRLSPLFTEEMMGFPLMWTALPFLSLSGETNL